MSRASSAAALTATICSAEIIGMAGLATFPALLPTFFDIWSLTNTDAGWINGIYFAGYLTAVPVLVSLTDRVAARRVYFVSLAVSGLTSLGFALLAEGFWTAVFIRMVAGIGFAGTYMPGMRLLSDHLEGRARDRAIAFYAASFSIGWSLSNLLAGEVASWLDWRWAFGVAAGGPVLALILMFLGLPPHDPRCRAVPNTHLLDFRPVLRCGAAMRYVLAYTAHNFELYAMRSWIVAFLAFAESVRPGGTLGWSATELATLIILLGMPANVLGAELSGRFGRHRVVTIVMLSSAVVAMLLGFAAIGPTWLVLLLCLTYGLTIAGDSAPITAGVVASAPDGYRGATMAVYSCVGFLGSFLGPLAFGILLDRSGGGETAWSWGVAFAAMGAVVAMGPVALAVLREHGRPTNPPL